ncbi:hypothetical protein L1049_020284 [Liquidambar formosana]|uniref:Derlin n=1 Tax=Liquidambar formosana TaxID=63359 RepID=A0AAP0S9M0_LIQFO
MFGAREFPNERISIYGLVSLKGFYLPWAMLGLNLLFGNPLKPDILGIVAGHLHYFLTVLYPLSGGKYVFKTPLWVHKVVAFWGEGSQFNTPVQRDPSAGITFRGRSYRLNGTQTSTPAQAQTNTSQQQQPNPAAGGPFTGRSYRLNGQ